MKQHSANEIELRRYLLGDLALEERVAVEERLFLDVDYLDQLKAAEDELLDEYVYDELTAREREKVENRLLPEPGRHDDLSFAKAFKEFVTSEAVPVPPVPAPGSSDDPRAKPARDVPLIHSLFGRRPAVSLSLAFALLLAVVGLIWFATDSARRRERQQPGQAQETRPPQSEGVGQQPEMTGRTRANENTQGEGEQLTAGPETAPTVSEERGTRVGKLEERRPRRSPGPSGNGRPPGRTLALLLAPGNGIREDGEADSLAVPSDVGVVILQLALVERDDYRSYRAALRAGQQTLRLQRGLKSALVSGVKVVPLEVPARLLRQQTYQVKLSGLTPGGRVQEIASYSFKVGE